MSQQTTPGPEGQRDPRARATLGSQLGHDKLPGSATPPRLGRILKLPQVVAGTAIVMVGGTCAVLVGRIPLPAAGLGGIGLILFVTAGQLLSKLIDNRRDQEAHVELRSTLRVVLEGAGDRSVKLELPNGLHIEIAAPAPTRSGRRQLQVVPQPSEDGG